MTKTVNYTPEQTEELVVHYVAANSDESRAAVVATFADKFGKAVASIRAKLVREKVYVAKVRVAKDGESIASKDTLATRIGELLGLPENAASSLAKANKTALKAVVAALEAREATD